MLEEFLGSEFVGAALYVALFSFLLMLIAIKGAIYLVFTVWWDYHGEGEAPPEEWPLRSLVVNVITLLLATGIAFGKYEFDWLTTCLVGVLATSFSIAGYEPLKNLLGAIGFDLDRLNAFHYFS